jgi:hypothetical protein
MRADRLKRVLVFIASPGDVLHARNSVRHAVERLNTLVAKDNGFLLEPIGWEDVPPGKGHRSQEVINPYVDAAAIFIGILHRRFGEPTGITESGTEEEYNRIEHRWEKEAPKPEVLMYFKRIPDEELAHPGEQLKKVLAFKERIRETCLYKDFESEDALLELVEDALHNWVLRNTEGFESPGPADRIVTQGPYDKDVLACVVGKGSLSVPAISSHLGRPTTDVEASVHRLQELGLVLAEARGIIRPVNSTSGFLAITRHLNTDAHYESLLSSTYVQNMLSSSLRAHIQSRFHCELSVETVECLQSIARLSPSAMTYLLFGDTSVYDNLCESVRGTGNSTKGFANDLMQNRMIICTLLEYGVDYTRGKILTMLGPRRLAGQLLTVDLKVAYEEAKAFGIGAAMPVVCARAGCDLSAGQMSYGTSEFAIRNGTVYMHLDLVGLAQQQFDQALLQELSDSARATALNNKGFIYLQCGQVADAIPLFEQALEIAPRRAEPQKNLEFAKIKLSQLSAGFILDKFL